MLLSFEFVSVINIARTPFMKSRLANPLVYHIISRKAKKKQFPSSNKQKNQINSYRKKCPYMITTNRLRFTLYQQQNLFDVCPWKTFYFIYRTHKAVHSYPLFMCRRRRRTKPSISLCLFLFFSILKFSSCSSFKKAIYLFSCLLTDIVVVIWLYTTKYNIKMKWNRRDSDERKKLYKNAKYLPFIRNIRGMDGKKNHRNGTGGEEIVYE